MSCLIAEKETVSKVSNFISRFLNQGFNSFGFAPTKAVFDGFNDCTICGFYNSDLIYKKLYELNFAAYNGRYLEGQEEKPEEIEIFYKNQNIDIWENRVYKNGFENVQPWHFEIYKHIQFLHYQLCEDATQEHATRKALQELEIILARFIVSTTAEYNAIQWR
jgi:hypothetical protein